MQYFKDWRYIKCFIRVTSLSAYTACGIFLSTTATESLLLVIILLKCVGISLTDRQIVYQH